MPAIKLGEALNQMSQVKVEPKELVVKTYTAKEVLVFFMKNSKPDKWFDLSDYAQGYANPKALEQSMRTELSRIRTEIKRRGNKPQKFMLSFRHEDDDKQEVFQAMRRIDTRRNELENSFEEIMDLFGE